MAKSVKDKKTRDICWRKTGCDKGNLQRIRKDNNADEVVETGSKSSEPEDEGNSETLLV